MFKYKIIFNKPDKQKHVYDYVVLIVLIISYIVMLPN